MMTSIRIPIACAIILAPIAIASDDLTESRTLIPLNIGQNGSFGFSIAASLTRTVTGTPLAEYNGNDSGAAYVHVTNTGQQLFRLLPDDPSPFAEFGASVAATGQRAIVGAPGANGPQNECGAVYLFNIQTGEQTGKLTASDAASFAEFGHSVSASGGRLIVGARIDDQAGQNAGAAYIYDLASGQQLHKLFASDPRAFDAFGSSVALSGNLAAVGAPNDDKPGGLLGAGSAHLFDVTTGELIHKLTPDDQQFGAGFGTSVAISGNLVVVGSAGGNDSLSSGWAYVFDAGSGQQLHRLSPNKQVKFDRFGESVAISGNFIVVGARDRFADADGGGAAFVFDAQTGQELFRLFSSNGENFVDAFGTSVAVLGTRAFVGAPRGGGTVLDYGRSYVFDLTPCFADVNNDNTVNLADLNIVLGNFGQATSIGDTNSDGVVDLADLNRVLSDFGTDCP